MDGLQKNSKMSAITQWYEIFIKQKYIHSSESYDNWKYVELLGLPNHDSEDWKYTSLNKLLSYQFTSAINRAVSIIDCNALSLKLDAYRLVFIDGQFSSTLSDKNTGVWQINVEKGMRRTPLPTPIKKEIFLHLIESLSKETTRILLPSGKKADRALYLLHISQGSKSINTLNMLHYRHHIDIGKGANGHIIEHFVSIDSYGHFSGSRTSITIKDNAYCNYTKLSLENKNSFHFSNNDINIYRNAVVYHNTIIFGALLNRHKTNIQLNGEGSNLNIRSLQLPSSKNVSDNQTYLEHNKGYCFSHQLHKIIAQEQGKGVFDGLIKVSKTAPKTDSKMINNNLIVDYSATVNTKPHLEIYNDNVKCSHGATVGSIDEEQIFFLRSRGISYKDAKYMIIYSFAIEATDFINQNEVRKTILKYIAKVLQNKR